VRGEEVGVAPVLVVGVGVRRRHEALAVAPEQRDELGLVAQVQHADGVPGAVLELHPGPPAPALAAAEWVVHLGAVEHDLRVVPSSSTQLSRTATDSSGRAPVTPAKATRAS